MKKLAISDVTTNATIHQIATGTLLTERGPFATFTQTVTTSTTPPAPPA